MEIMLKSNIVRETLNAKGYDLEEVETGKVIIGKDLRRLLEKLADDKPVALNSDKDKPEATILKKGRVTHGGTSMIDREPENKEVVLTLVGKSRKTF